MCRTSDFTHLRMEIPGQARNEDGQDRNEGPSTGSGAVMADLIGHLRVPGGGGPWGCPAGRGIWRWCGGRLCSPWR